MKYFIFFVFSVNALLQASFAQTVAINSSVDERVELMSVVCRLAEYEEYNQEFDYSKNIFGKAYRRDVDNYFSKFKSDSLIRYAKHIRLKQDIAYDAPMKFAVSIEITDSIRFVPELLQGIEVIDSRWTKKSAKKFLILLNKFYFKTNFRSFFDQHKSIFFQMENSFSNVISGINLTWYEAFFGEKSNGSFNVILSGLNGNGNYGPKNTFKDGTQRIYSVMGPWIFDSTLNVNEKDIAYLKRTLIHEFNHSFCNKLIFKYIDKMGSKPTKMYMCVKPIMKRQAYGNSKTMMCELLVRACVIKYFQDVEMLPEREVKKALIKERLLGFHWIDTLYFSLNQFDKQRNAYPSLDSFIPNIVQLISTLETRDYIKQFDKKCPELHIETSITNADKTVSSDTKELIVRFDRKMDIGSNGATYGKKGQKYYPKVSDAYWNKKNQQEWILKLDLEPNKKYSIAFPYEWFQDENGYPGKKGKYYLDFKTK